MSEVGRNVGVPEIIHKYRIQRGLAQGRSPVSSSELARQLSLALAPHGSVMRASMSAWERGISAPLYWQMLSLYLIGNGWARAFALEVLQVLRPDLWTGPNVLSYSHSDQQGPDTTAESGEGDGAQ